MLLMEAYESLVRYEESLRREELSKLTAKKYIRDIIRFFETIDRETFDKTDLLNYKNSLMSRYKDATVNSYLISVNRFLCWLGYPETAVKTLRIQRNNEPNTLSRTEYEILLRYCLEHGKRKYYLLIRTLACTGMRVGELKYITLDTVLRGAASVRSKGKSREVFIPIGLTKELIEYCKDNNINGIVFFGKNENSTLQPSSVWKVLKRIAGYAKVNPDKVYPHSLRRLFAKTYMQKVGNLFELADLMGHSSVETTRIYAHTSSREKQKSLDILKL